MKNNRRFPLIKVKQSQYSGLGGSVDIATGYGLDGPGIEFRWR